MVLYFPATVHWVYYNSEKRLEIVPKNADIVRDAYNYFESVISQRATKKYIRERYGINWGDSTFRHLLSESYTQVSMTVAADIMIISALLSSVRSNLNGYRHFFPEMPGLSIRQNIHIYFHSEMCGM